MQESIARDVQGWAKSLARVQDVAIRRGRLARNLAVLGPIDLVGVLVEIVNGANTGRGGYADLLAALPDLGLLLEDRDVGYQERARLEAERLGCEVVARMIGNPPSGRLDPPPPVEPGQLAHERTLGERLSLALSPDRRVMERLLHDPHPLVIRRLLANPRLTLQMVVRMAARRPARPACLVEIRSSLRWGARYEVQLAIARNPYAPNALAVRLLPGLHIQDLREVAEDGALDPAVTGLARDLVYQRQLGVRCP